jgi:hypothetical protein
VNFADPAGTNRLQCGEYTDYGCADTQRQFGGGAYINWGSSEDGPSGGFLPGDPVGGGDPIGSGGGNDTGLAAATIIKNAERGAADRLFNADCAGLFLTADQNTAANRAALSRQLDGLEDAGTIREIDPQYLPNGGSPNVPAFTTGTNGIVYVVSNSAFFTGQINGHPIGGFASGMTLADFQQLVIIHEFLHWQGVGPDSSGQKYTLPNGDKVKGSTGISKEVKQKCFN